MWIALVTRFVIVFAELQRSLLRPSFGVQY
jgi:hypothetical protein